jgi:pyrroline-5-carboxylate reductase
MDLPSSTSAPRLLVIGGGHMGGAILRGIVSSGLIRPDRVALVDPDPEKRRAAAGLGVRTVESLPSALRAMEPGTHLLLAVKPQSFPAVAADLRQASAGPGPPAHGSRLLISIMAGVTIATIEAAVPGVRCVRVMPNLPASIGRSTSAISTGPSADTADLRFVLDIFSTLGRVLVIPEGQMDAFTAVAGSGPAYLFLLAEAMIRGAVRQGFSRQQATELVLSTVTGAAAMLETRNGVSPDPAVLRQAVTSRGGTTAAALHRLEEGRFLDLMAEAIDAAARRSRELSASSATNLST